MVLNELFNQIISYLAVFVEQPQASPRSANKTRDKCEITKTMTHNLNSSWFNFLL